MIKTKPTGNQRKVMEILSGISGGNSVDDAFEKFLCDIVGKRILYALKDESMEDYIDICRQFEGKKRSFAAGSKSHEKERVYGTKTKKESIFVPATLAKLVKTDKSMKGMDNAVKQSPYAQQVSFARHKLQIPESTFSGFVQPTIDCVINHMEKMFFGNYGIDAVVLVGGLAESEHVQNSFKEKLWRTRVFIPDDPTLAVFKGAILSGFKIQPLHVAPYTYGVQSLPTFNKSFPLEKLVVVNGTFYCKDVFSKYVEKGQRLTPGYSKSRVFRALKSDEDTLQCAVYISDQRYPNYVDEPGCHLLGILNVPLDASVSGPVEIQETLIFGETELTVRAKIIKTGVKYEAQFDLP